MSVDTVTSFYEAFARRDAESMVKCYANDVRFSDPVFHDLQGERAKAMWRMLCARGKDLTIEFRDVRADGDTGSAHWEARYTFSATGRKVYNVVDATFRFAPDGKIVEHTDSFALWRWMRMALGLKGLLVGWAPFAQTALRRTAARGLEEWISASKR